MRTHVQRVVDQWGTSLSNLTGLRWGYSNYRLHRDITNYIWFRCSLYFQLTPNLTSYQMRVMESLIEYCEEVEDNEQYVSSSKQMTESATTPWQEIFIFTCFIFLCDSASKRFTSMLPCCFPSSRSSKPMTSAAWWGSAMRGCCEIENRESLSDEF